MHQIFYKHKQFLLCQNVVFILVLSLTRNVSYFTDEVPGDFLATSTTVTQCNIQHLLNLIRESTNKNVDETKKKLEELIEMMRNNSEIKGLIKMIIEEVGNKEV